MVFNEKTTTTKIISLYLVSTQTEKLVTVQTRTGFSRMQHRLTVKLNTCSENKWRINQAEVGIYKRKRESMKKERKQALNQ